MDAVKFLRERDRMCNTYSVCNNNGCPVIDKLRCVCKDTIDEDYEELVKIVEDWSKENPEVVGKKYIIEIDEVDRNRGQKKYHVKGAHGFWISKGNLTDLEEYKENEKGKQHGCS